MRFRPRVGSYGDVKYAAIQEYGGKTAAHEILPDKGNVLAFLVAGAMHFARRVEHPGSIIPERSYLRSSLDEMSADIVAALAATPAETLGGRMSREAAFSALFAAVSAAYPWGLASRRMKLWSEVPAALRPALFQLESGPETYQWASPATPKRTLEAKLFLYFDARDPDDARLERDQRRARRARRGPRPGADRSRLRPPDARRRGA